MWGYIARRLLQCVPVLIGVTMVSFAIVHALPGSPAEVLLGPRASAEQIEAAAEELGLNKPLPIQYLKYLGRLIRGDLGVSWSQKDLHVSKILIRDLGVSARLALGAMSFAMLLGIPLGILSARKPYGKLDNLAMGVSLIGVCTPAFWLAMLLVLIFGVWLRWLPISGYEPGSLAHLVLPSVTLGAISAAILARMTRASILDAMGEDYIRTARSRGLSEWRTLLAHAFPNAALPLITVIGSNLASLFTGAVLTETVFSLPGMGRELYEAIFNRDYNLMLGCIVVMAVIFVLANLAVDILYAFLDPRLRRR